MSANNQTLIKEYKGKWYVFENINAESWGDGKNELNLKLARAVFGTKDEALKKAFEIDNESGQWQEGTEYGVCFETLAKDNAEVIIKD